MTTKPHDVLVGEYFYPVAVSQPGVKAYVATNKRASKNTTPGQLIMDKDTCVVYLVDANGMLYMQPAECFPHDILNAPLWKTIPLPKDDFRLSCGLPTPPTTPPKPSSGLSSSSLAYTGQESAQWQQQRVRRDSAHVYPYPSSSSSVQQPQPQYRYAVSQSYPPSSGMYYVPQPQQAPVIPTQKKKHVRFE